MFRRSSPRKTRDGKVGGAPEKVHRAAFADEASAKLFENPVSLYKNPPEPIGILAIIRAVSFVLVEADSVSNFVGFRVNLYVQFELRHFLHQARVESRHRLCFERKTTGTAVARVDRKPMLHEVKIDLEYSIATRDY